MSSKYVAALLAALIFAPAADAQSLEQNVNTAATITPSTTISNPSISGSKLSSSPTLTGTINDIGDSGIQRVGVAFWSNDRFVPLKGSGLSAWTLFNASIPLFNATVLNVNPNSANWSLTTSLPVGRYTMTVYLFDAAGNFSAANPVSRQFSIVGSDQTAPTATVSNPSESDAQLLTSPILAGTISDTGGSGIDRVGVALRSNGGYVSLNGTALSSWTLFDASIPNGNPNSADWSLATSLPVGIYSMEVYPFDAAGNYSADNNVLRQFTIVEPEPEPDTVAPSATVTHPIEEGSQVTASPTLTGTVTDTGGSGVQRVAVAFWSNGGFVSLDGSALSSWTQFDASFPSGNPDSANWSLPTTLPVGKYTMIVYSYDAAGNYSSDNRVHRLFTVEKAGDNTQHSCSGFCSVDNFDTRINGSIRTQGNWETNPPGALDGAIVLDNPPGAFSGKAMVSDPSGVQFRGNAYKPLGVDAIRDGETGTFFFQIYADDLSNTYSHIGLTDLASPRLTDEGTGEIQIYTDFEVQFSLREGRMRIKDGQDSLDLTNITAQNRTLYNVWLVVNNQNDTYEVYVQGGSYTTPVRGEVDGRSVFSFRNGQASNDLQTFLFLNSPETPTGKVFFDNLFIEPDERNLNNPVFLFYEVDTFEALAVGDLNNRNGWSTSSADVDIVSDPTDNNNQVLTILGNDVNASKLLQPIANNRAGTLFFRMRRNGLVNSSIGLSDVLAPTDFADFENQVNVQNSQNLNIRDGNSFTSVDRFEENTWYCVWIMTDNATDTYTSYMKGGSLDQITLLDSVEGQTQFNYRNGTSDALSSFFVRVLGSNSNFYLDDIYADTNGENFSIPTGNSCESNVNVEIPINDPIPATISKSGLAVELQEFARIPASSNDLPIARINFLGHANENRNRLFVNDLRNSLYVIENGNVSTYLNIKEQFEHFNSEPRLGSGFGFFSFHPEYSDNGIFYTVHTETGGALSASTTNFSSSTTDAVHGVITEWTANNPSGNEFSGSKREILRVGFRKFLHGIQQIGFNPTAQPGSIDYGLLYIAIGDGEENPNFTNGPQDLSVPNGKILLIDPLGTDSSNGQYGIPGSNPFLNTDGALGEIWAYGLRNPHRFSWDAGGTNKMFIGNIGEKNIDSVYPGIAGANYGWNEREGSFLFKKDNPNVVYPLPANDAEFGYTYPVAQYDHDEGFALVGGFVYRGTSIPALQGKYIFGDIVNGRIFYTEETDMVLGQPSARIQELTLLDTNGVEKTLKQLINATRADLRFGVDSENEVYFLSKQNGMVWRMTSAN